jgi:hypothetical protein
VSDAAPNPTSLPSPVASSYPTSTLAEMSNTGLRERRGVCGLLFTASALNEGGGAVTDCVPRWMAGTLNQREDRLEPAGALELVPAVIAAYSRLSGMDRARVS